MDSTLVKNYSTYLRTNCFYVSIFWSMLSVSSLRRRPLHSVDHSSGETLYNSVFLYVVLRNFHYKALACEFLATMEIKGKKDFQCWVRPSGSGDVMSTDQKVPGSIPVFTSWFFSSGVLFYNMYGLEHWRIQSSQRRHAGQLDLCKWLA
jgi:hypothetical protein